ncbi:MAG: FRG domain-containing protein [Pseudomonadota bacterium]
MMRTIKSLKDLRAIAAKYSSGYIFRGQTKQYVSKDGELSINASFDPKDWIPPLMQKWNLYCEEILLHLKDQDDEGDVGLTESQAILQHYGWRSSFIDFSRELDVACWFAANECLSELEQALVEDWQEVGLMTCHRTAAYREHTGYGYLYIVDSSMLAGINIGIEEFERFRFSDLDSRIERQSVAMVGPLSSLSMSVVVDVLEVPIKVLRDYSSHLSQQLLFPNRNEDCFYKMLLAAPFTRSQQPEPSFGGFDRYEREIEILEYDYTFNKRPAKNTAFYNPQYFIDPQKPDAGVVVRVPDSFLHHAKVDLPNSIDNVLKLFGESKTITIETKGILSSPIHHDRSIFLKGVVIQRVSNETICVSGLMIDHPGLTYAAIAAGRGWHYTLVNGNCIQEKSEFDCRCNNKRKHNLQFSLLQKLQGAISQGLVSFQNGYYLIPD